MQALSRFDRQVLGWSNRCNLWRIKWLPQCDR